MPIPGDASTERTRIAIFLFSLAGGGAERAMLHLAAGLARRGTAIDLVLIRKEGAYLEQLPPGVRIVDLAAGRTLYCIGPLLRYLRQARPAVLLSALTAQNVTAIVMARLFSRGSRVIVCEQSQAHAEIENARRATARLAYMLMPLVYRFAHGIVAVSRGVARSIAQRAYVSAGRIEVIYNPIVSRHLDNLAADRVEHPWFAPGEPPLILGAGRLVPQKDFPTLIKAFALIRKERVVRLIILGEGDDRAALLRLADDLAVRADVDLPGFFANPFAMMARARVFVLSSAWEGLPTVLIEAMACGTPVVATDCPDGPAEILEGGQFGRLVPVGDAARLASAIMETMDQPLAPQLLRARAADFSIDRSVERYLSLVHERQ